MTIQGAITGQIEVERIGNHRITARSPHLLGNTTIDQSAGGGSGGEMGASERVAPGGRAVPGILHGRIVIQVETIGDVFFANRLAVSVAQLGVVP